MTFLFAIIPTSLYYHLHLKCQEEILEKKDKYLTNKNNSIKLITEEIEINKIDDFKELFCKSKYKNKMDIVQSFKFCNEIYNNKKSDNSQVYTKMMEVAEYCLNASGMLLLEDVTTSTAEDKKVFFPSLMSLQIKEYLKKEKTSFNYVIPKPCGSWYNKCEEKNCYSQIIFEVFTTNKEKPDESKVTYNLLIKGKMGKTFHEEEATCDEYVINKNRNECCSCIGGKTPKKNPEVDGKCKNSAFLEISKEDKNPK